MDEIKIGGVVYKIEYKDPALMPEDEGFCDPKHKVIWVNNELNSREKKEVLIHESLHAVIYEAGIRDLDSHFEHIFVYKITDYIMENFIADQDEEQHGDNGEG